MALPADVSTRQVHGAWLGMDGNPRGGHVTFTPTAEKLVNPGTDTIITGTVITAHLDTDGEMTATLPCTNDPDLSGGPFSYLVTVTLIGDAAPHAFWIDLPESEDVLELADVTPILPAEGGGNLVFSVNGETGHVVLSPADIGAEASGAAASAVAAHVGASDPHPQYLTAAEGTAAYVPKTGGQMTGNLELVSTADGGLNTSDSTSRLILNSYQAGGNNWSEVIRIRLRPQADDVVENRAKGMVTWQLPNPLDSDDPADYESVTWVGAHWGHQGAETADDIHGHWSVETPDALRRLQTRFAISLADEAGNLGADKTIISTTSADFVVGCDSGQVARLKSGPATSAQIEVAKTVWGGTSKRWRFGGDGATESGSNAGTNWRLQRYSDTGGDIDTPILVQRGNGRTIIGGELGTASGLDVRRAGSGTALTVDTYISGSGGTGITGYQHLSKDATSIAVSTRVAAEPIDRWRAYSDGKLEWGTGSAGRDTTLARTGAATLGLTGALTISSTLGVTGNTTVGGTFGVTGAATFTGAVTVPTPTTSGHAVTKAYADALTPAVPSPPRASLGRVADLALTSGTVTAVPMLTSNYEVGGDWWTTGSSIIVPTGLTGLYLVYVRAIFKSAGANTGERSVWVRQLTGGPLVDDPPVAAQTVGAPGGAGWVDVSVTSTATLTAGLTYYVSVRQGLGAGLDLYGAEVSLTRIPGT